MSYSEMLDLDIVEDTEKCNTALMASSAVFRDYLIVFNGRSGSSWLGKKLAGTLGFPDEYLNPAHVELTARSLGTANKEKMLRCLRGSTATNGVFGIEATAEHIKLFGEDIFFSVFGKIKTFNLYRENIVAQSVSLYKAVKTGHFHSIDGVKPENPSIDFAEIQNWMRYLCSVENLNFEMCVLHDLTPINITYETIFIDEKKTVDLFFNELGIESVSEFKFDVNPLNKISDSWSIDVEEEFRRMFPSFIEEIESARSVMKFGWKSLL